jgi:hypothetical protein
MIQQLIDGLRARAAAHGGDALLVSAADEMERLTAEREAWLNLNAVVKSLTAAPKEG